MLLFIPYNGHPITEIYDCVHLILLIKMLIDMKVKALATYKGKRTLATLVKQLFNHKNRIH